MAERGKSLRPSNRLLGALLAVVVLGLYLSIQLVWAAKGY